MTDPRRFKAPFNPKERIWQEADRLRAAHPAGRELPVKILDLLLMGDLKSILVDKRGFMSPRLEYRLRFSVAHEIGHLILHREICVGVYRNLKNVGDEAEICAKIRQVSSPRSRAPVALPSSAW